MTGQGREIERLPAGIPGLDEITGGGLPRTRLSLVTGTAGSGKTVFAVQFLADGVRRGEAGVFVTLEERPTALRRNFRSFGWDVEAWERDGLWAFVDVSPRPEEDPVTVGEFDLAALVVRVRHAVAQVGASRVAIDATGALVDHFDDVRAARRALLQIGAELEELGVTSVMTAERGEDYGSVSRHGFEEFVADNVLILRNTLEVEKRRRTIEVLKLRGGSHRKGEHLFTLVPDDGMVVVPHEQISFEYGSSHRRLRSGNEGLDTMLRGGLFDKSLALLSGPTGVGKSLLSTHFVAGGAEGERSILFSFEESRDQLVRNAQAWGFDLQALEDAGRLRIVAEAPEAATLELHLLRMKREMADFRPDRVAIDSLTALQRIATARSFRDYLLGMSFHIKSQATLGLVTATSDDLGGGLSSGALHLSTVSDTVINLHYVVRRQEILRAINVLKQRGSDHDKAIREFRIGDRGLQVLEPLPIGGFGDLPRAE